MRKNIWWWPRPKKFIDGSSRKTAQRRVFVPFRLTPRKRRGGQQARGQLSASSAIPVGWSDYCPQPGPQRLSRAFVGHAKGTEAAAFLSRRNEPAALAFP